MIIIIRNQLKIFIVVITVGDVSLCCTNRNIIIKSKHRVYIDTSETLHFLLPSQITSCFIIQQTQSSPALLIHTSVSYPQPQILSHIHYTIVRTTLLLLMIYPVPSIFIFHNYWKIWLSKPSWTCHVRYPLMVGPGVCRH